MNFDSTFKVWLFEIQVNLEWWKLVGSPWSRLDADSRTVWRAQSHWAKKPKYCLLTTLCALQKIRFIQFEEQTLVFNAQLCEGADLFEVIMRTCRSLFCDFGCSSIRAEFCTNFVISCTRSRPVSDWLASAFFRAFHSSRSWSKFWFYRVARKKSKILKAVLLKGWVSKSYSKLLLRNTVQSDNIRLRKIPEYSWQNSLINWPIRCSEFSSKEHTFRSRSR